MYLNALVWLVDRSRRHALAVVVGGLLLTLGCGWYTIAHIAITTDTDQIISPDLPWRKLSAEVDRQFPQMTDGIDVVIDGATPELAANAAAVLTEKIAARTDLFKSAYRPDGGDFFAKEGLLFLSPKELDEISTKIAGAQPLLAALVADPSLRGLDGVLKLAVEGFAIRQGDPAQLDIPLRSFAATLDGVLEGHAKPLSWETLMTGQPPRAEALRRFVSARPILDTSHPEPGLPATGFIRDTAKQLGFTPDKGVRVRLTGQVPVADEEYASVMHGAGLSTVLSFVFVALILFFGLRSPRVILAILVSLVVGLIWTAAFATAAFPALNMISIAFAVLFIGIGVDFGIQFCMRYRSESFRQVDHAKALRETARTVGGSLSLAAAAAGVGFLSFIPTDYRGVSQLGLIAGVGMALALLANLTVLPALLTVLPSRGRPESPVSTIAAQLYRWVEHRSRIITVLTVLVGIGAALLLPKARFDFDPFDLRDPTTESVSTVRDLARDPNTTPYTLEVLAPTLKEAEALADRIGKVKEVRQTITAAGFVPDDQAAKLDAIQGTAMLLGPVLDGTATLPPPSPAELRGSIDELATALGGFLAGDKGKPLAASGAAFLKAVTALAARDDATLLAGQAALVSGFPAQIAQLRLSLQAEPVTLESLPDSFRRDWLAPDGVARISVQPAIDPADHDALRRFVAEVRKVAPNATGPSASIIESGDTVTRAFAKAALWAFLAITVLLLAVLRSVRHTVLVLVPLALAGLCALAFSAVIGPPLNFANIIALPLLLGIGVAFDIYFVMSWRRGEGPVRQASLARAVFVSALTTTVAFGGLAFSTYPGMATMGQLLGISLGFALLSTLIVLPALLVRFGGRRKPPVQERRISTYPTPKDARIRTMQIP